VGRACGTHGGEKNAHRLQLGTVKKIDSLEDTYIDGGIILKQILHK
jgi:hypothetical protein